MLANLLQYLIFPLILAIAAVLFARRRTKLEIATLEDNRLFKWRDDALTISEKLITEQKARAEAERQNARLQKDFDDFRIKCRCQAVNVIEIKLIDTTPDQNLKETNLLKA